MAQIFIVDEKQAGQRLDIFCARHFPAYSRARLQQAVKNELVQVNSRRVKPRYLLRTGDQISVDLPPQTEAEITALPSVKFPIIFEDKDIVVINKPAGIAVHPGIGRDLSTVASWFKEHYPSRILVGEDPRRPGIVHRLDKDTSGVLVLAKNNPAYEHLKQQFKRQHTAKEYITVAFGSPGSLTGRINQPISRTPGNPLRRTIHESGKPAITEWKVEKKLGSRFTLLRVYPLTGRTHQIRVHLHFIRLPIVGDRLYVFKRQKPPAGVARQLLHAEKLTIRMLAGGRKTFVAPLPADITRVINSLEK